MGVLTWADKNFINSKNNTCHHAQGIQKVHKVFLTSRFETETSNNLEATSGRWLSQPFPAGAGHEGK